MKKRTIPIQMTILVVKILLELEKDYPKPIEIIARNSDSLEVPEVGLCFKINLDLYLSLPLKFRKAYDKHLPPNPLSLLDDKTPNSPHTSGKG